MASSCAGLRGEPSCRQERKGQLCSGSFKSPQPRDTRSLTVTSWLLRHAVLALLHATANALFCRSHGTYAGVFTYRHTYTNFSAKCLLTRSSPCPLIGHSLFHERGMPTVSKAWSSAPWDRVPKQPPDCLKPPRRLRNTAPGPQS